jgi:hypothetical protein
MVSADYQCNRFDDPDVVCCDPKINQYHSSGLPESDFMDSVKLRINLELSHKH